MLPILSLLVLLGTLDVTRSQPAAGPPAVATSSLESGSNSVESAEAGDEPSSDELFSTNSSINSSSTTIVNTTTTTPAESEASQEQTSDATRSSTSANSTTSSTSSTTNTTIVTTTTTTTTEASSTSVASSESEASQEQPVVEPSSSTGNATNSSSTGNATNSSSTNTTTSTSTASSTTATTEASTAASSESATTESQASQEQIASEEPVSANTSSSTVQTVTTTISTASSESELSSSEAQASEEQIASGEYEMVPTPQPQMEPTVATVAADNRNRSTAASTTNRPRAGEVTPVAVFPQQPATFPIFQPALPFTQPTFTQPTFTQPTFTQPIVPQRTAGSCQVNEHACPCIGGTYCLFRAAACLNPSIACPSEVSGTPAVGSSADVMVQASWTAPSAVSVVGTPLSSLPVAPYVRPPVASGALPTFQFSQFNAASASQTFPQFNAFSQPVTSLPASTFTFGSPVVAQGFIRASSVQPPLNADLVSQPQLTFAQTTVNTGAQSTFGTSQPLLSAGSTANLQPVFSSGLTIQGQSFQPANAIVAQPQVIRPATNLQPVFSSGLPVQGQSFQAANAIVAQPQVVRPASTLQPVFSSGLPVQGQSFQAATNVVLQPQVFRPASPQPILASGIIGQGQSFQPVAAQFPSAAPTPQSFFGAQVFQANPQPLLNPVAQPQVNALSVGVVAQPQVLRPASTIQG